MGASGCDWLGVAVFVWTALCTRCWALCVSLHVMVLQGCEAGRLGASPWARALRCCVCVWLCRCTALVWVCIHV